MIKVLHVLNSLNIGGAETLVMNIFKTIDRESFSMDIIIHDKDKIYYKKQVEDLGGKVFYIPKLKLFNYFKYKMAWKTFFREHPEYCIIHGHVRSTASIYLKIAKKFGLKTIAHCHSAGFVKDITVLIRKLFQRNIKKYSDICAACSIAAGIHLYGKDIIQCKNFVVFNNGINVLKYKYDEIISDKIRTMHKIKKDDLVLINVGRFSIEKNHEYLIKLFNLLRNKSINIKLFLLGEGLLKNKIYELSKQLNLSNDIIFTGSVSNVNEYLIASDIFILPSLFEGLPFAIIEAQAAGLVCIKSNTITDECVCTNDVYNIDISNKIEENVAIISKITKKDNTNRINDNELVNNSKYNVNNLIYELQQVYIQLSQLSDNDDIITEELR